MDSIMYIVKNPSAAIFGSVAFFKILEIVVGEVGLEKTNICPRTMHAFNTIVSVIGGLFAFGVSGGSPTAFCAGYIGGELAVKNVVSATHIGLKSLLLYGALFLMYKVLTFEKPLEVDDMLPLFALFSKFLAVLLTDSPVKPGFVGLPSVFTFITSLVLIGYSTYLRESATVGDATIYVGILVISFLFTIKSFYTNSRAVRGLVLLLSTIVAASSAFISAYIYGTRSTAFVGYALAAVTIIVMQMVHYAAMLPNVFSKNVSLYIPVSMLVPFVFISTLLEVQAIHTTAYSIEDFASPLAYLSLSFVFVAGLVTFATRAQDSLRMFTPSAYRTASVDLLALAVLFTLFIGSALYADATRLKLLQVLPIPTILKTLISYLPAKYQPEAVNRIFRMAFAKNLSVKMDIHSVLLIAGSLFALVPAQYLLALVSNATVGFFSLYGNVISRASERTRALAFTLNVYGDRDVEVARAILSNIEKTKSKTTLTLFFSAAASTSESGKALLGDAVAQGHEIGLLGTPEATHNFVALKRELKTIQSAVSSVTPSSGSGNGSASTGASNKPPASPSGSRKRKGSLAAGSSSEPLESVPVHSSASASTDAYSHTAPSSKSFLGFHYGGKVDTMSRMCDFEAIPRFPGVPSSIRLYRPFSGLKDAHSVMAAARMGLTTCLWSDYAAITPRLASLGDHKFAEPADFRTTADRAADEIVVSLLSRHLPREDVHRSDGSFNEVAAITAESQALNGLIINLNDPFSILPTEKKSRNQVAPVLADLVAAVFTRTAERLIRLTDNLGSGTKSTDHEIFKVSVSQITNIINQEKEVLPVA